MKKAKVVLSLQVGLATLSLGVLALAVYATSNVVTLRPASARELLAACSQFALPDVSVVAVLALGLGSLALAVVALSVRSLVRQAIATRRFLNALPVTGAGPRGSRIFAAAAPQAFCAGLLRPQIYVADAALLELQADELDAVLAHEEHHRRLRDPLRIALARAASEGLFFLPAARLLADRYRSLAELAADGAAVRRAGTQPLASALLTFEQADPAVVGIAPERVDHLFGDEPPWQLPVALIVWSLLVLAAVAAISFRLAESSQMTVSLPLVAAQSCMALMALLPMLLGAGAILVARRAAGRRD